MTHELKPLKVGVAQMTSIDDVNSNEKQFVNLLNTAPSDVDLLCFPENTFYLRLDRKGQGKAIELGDGVVKRTENWVSERNKIVLVGGTPVLEKGQVYNATLLFEPNQTAKIVYRKIHLFDVDVKGETSYRESDDFANGNRPQVINVKGWGIGLSICYDLRFPELYLAYAKREVPVIVVPSAFLVETGRAHWHTLLKARAIECQAYVLAPAQAGEHKNGDGKKRMTYGHSLIIDPWGRVVSELEAPTPGWLTHDLNFKNIEDVRTQIPMADHRKL